MQQDEEYDGMIRTGGGENETRRSTASEQVSGRQGRSNMKRERKRKGPMRQMPPSGHPPPGRGGGGGGAGGAVAAKAESKADITVTWALRGFRSVR
jgi:hypothetical protein